MKQMQDIKTTNNINKKILVMRAEKSEDIFFDKETVKKLLKSEEDIEKGRTKKASEVLEELREKYGF